MKILFRIYTPSNRIYFVNQKGEISENETYFSGGWIFKGLQSVKSNFYIPFIEVTKETLKDLSLTYKNGNPKFTVRDLDHGTTREWGNTRFNGVKCISFV